MELVSVMLGTYKWLTLFFISLDIVIYKLSENNTEKLDACA